MGEGVAKDKAEAVTWYRHAAYSRHAEAQYNLARCYATGDGVAKDEEDAVSWYRSAADQGHAEAKRALSDIGKKKR